MKEQVAGGWIWIRSKSAVGRGEREEPSEGRTSKRASPSRSNQRAERRQGREGQAETEIRGQIRGPGTRVDWRRRVGARGEEGRRYKVAETKRDVTSKEYAHRLERYSYE